MKKSIVILITVGVIITIIATASFSMMASELSDYPLWMFESHVTDVIDGDTIEVDHVRIRLSLTSTPELDEKGGVKAKQFTSNLCPLGSLARVVVDGGQPQDQYGRMLAKVYCGDELLNSELLEYDLATIDKRFCSKSEFSGEDWAKKYGC